MSNNSNSFWAFLSGIALGGIVGILYAPDKGKNTRDKLSFQLEKYKEKLQELIDDLVDGKEEATSPAKKMSEKVTNDAIQEAEKLMGSIDALQSRIKQETETEN